MTWSSSGTTTILFSILGYNNSVIPSRISVNSSSGLLKIDAQNVYSNSEFDFYINSNVTGLPNFVQKLIRLTIDSCNVQITKNVQILVFQYVLYAILVTISHQDLEFLLLLK